MTVFGCAVANSEDGVVNICTAVPGDDTARVVSEAVILSLDRNSDWLVSESAFEQGSIRFNPVGTLYIGNAQVFCHTCLRTVGGVGVIFIKRDANTFVFDVIPGGNKVTTITAEAAFSVNTV